MELEKLAAGDLQTSAVQTGMSVLNILKAIDTARKHTEVSSLHFIHLVSSPIQ